jgi:hypothetical protein
MGCLGKGRECIASWRRIAVECIERSLLIYIDMYWYQCPCAREEKMYGEGVRIEREKLYEEVWSTPMVRLAQGYGISDVGLAKVCKKLKIPVPSRGYWQKIKSGKRVLRKSLPPLAKGQKNVAMIGRTTKPARNNKEQAHIDSEKLPENSIVVEDTLADVHLLVEKTQKSLINAKADNSGLLAGRDHGCLDIRVGKDSLDRAFRIMDALLKALDRRGYPVSVDEEKRTTKAKVLGEMVTFSLEEILDRSERLLTPAQEKDKARNPWRYPRPEYVYNPSGRLLLKIIDPSWREIGRRTWSDGKKQRVENILNSFVIGLIKASVAEREWRIRHEQWERERKEEERRRRERQRLQEAEERKLWGLFTDSICWHRSQQIRAYIQAVEDAVEKSTGDIAPDSTLDQWITWAQKQADRLDPLAAFSYCTKEDRKNDRSTYHTKPTPETEFNLAWQRLIVRSDYFERSTVWWADRPRW